MSADKQYIYRGKKIFVAELQERHFYTVWISTDGIKKISIKELPMRKTKKTAQKDLDAWAASKKLKEAEENDKR